MDITKENFPLYDLMLRNRLSYAMIVQPDYEWAQTGDEEAKLAFVEDMLNVVADQEKANKIMGTTPEMNETTLKSCITVLEEIEANGHPMAGMLLEELKREGHYVRPVQEAPPAPAAPPQAVIHPKGRSLRVSL